MSSIDARQPPRFVPTLTDVVVEPVGVSKTAAAMPVQTDRAVPVEPTTEQIAKPIEVVTQQDCSELALSLQARVMARLDDALEERLRYALADMVQLHTHALYQAIRQDVERLVSASVHDAIAQELLHMRAPPK